LAIPADAARAAGTSRSAGTALGLIQNEGAVVQGSNLNTLTRNTDYPDVWTWRERCDLALRWGKRLPDQSRDFIKSVGDAIDFDPSRYPTKRQKYWLWQVDEQVTDDIGLTV
jgi:hypothetical protein